MNKKPYAVIRFIEDETFSEIPTSWISDNGSIAHWPKEQRKAFKFMINGDIPDETWQKYKIEVERYCDTLEQARRRAEVCLTTDDEDFGRGKRKIIKKINSSSSDISESSGDIPIYNDNKKMTRNKEIANNNDEIMIEDNNNNNTENKNEILNVLDSLHQICSIILLEIKKIDSRLVKLENKRVFPSPQEDQFNDLFPLQTKEDLIEFEDNLKRDTFHKKFQEYLYRIGGKNPKENIIRCLKIIFSNKLATTCSWLGQRNNFKVKDLNLIKAVQCTIMSQHNELKICNFEKYTSEWFRLSKLRLEREEGKR